MQQIGAGKIRIGAMVSVFLLGLVSITIFSLRNSAAGSSTIIVNTTSDVSSPGDGYCSLREAITNTNSPGTDTTGGDCAVGTGHDSINFNVNGTIALGSTLPVVANNSTLTIDGTGQTITIFPEKVLLSDRAADLGDVVRESATRNV
jgi:CSLREA domain-containing protein